VIVAEMRTEGGWRRKSDSLQLVPVHISIGFRSSGSSTVYSSSLAIENGAMHLCLKHTHRLRALSHPASAAAPPHPSHHPRTQFPSSHNHIISHRMSGNDKSLECRVWPSADPSRRGRRWDAMVQTAES
jgi:hypothetical protein